MRIGTMDVSKAFFAVLIRLYHFFNVLSPNPHLPLGDVLVELYVLIAGVFFFMSWEKKKAAGSDFVQSPYPYLKRRFLRFLPYSVAGFALAAGVRWWMETVQGNALTWDTLLNWLPGDVIEMSMLAMNGLNDAKPLLNVPAWTLSAMLISEFVVCMLLVNCDKGFKTLVAPLAIIVGLGVWRFIPKANHEIWLGWTTFGLMRVFIIYCMSWYCYRLTVRLKNTNWTRHGKRMLTAAEVVLYAASMLIIMQYTSRNFRWLVTGFFILAVAITISGKSYSSKVFPHSKWTAYLGEWSMGVYLTHYPIMRVFRTLYPGESVLPHVWVYLGMVAVAAVIFCLVTDGLIKLCTALWKKWRSRLIQNA